MLKRGKSVQYTGSKPSPFLTEYYWMMDGRHPILDIGCGNMRNTKFLLRECYDVVAVDMKRPQCFGSEYVQIRTVPKDGLPMGIFSGFLLNYVLMFLGKQQQSRLARMIDERAAESATMFIELHDSENGHIYTIDEVTKPYLKRGWYFVRKQKKRAILRKGVK